MNLARSIGLTIVAALLTVAGTDADVVAHQPAEKSYPECIQDCFDDYVADLSDCDDDCKKCVEYWFFICIASVLDESCLNVCQDEAQGDYGACKKAGQG